MRDQQDDRIVTGQAREATGARSGEIVRSTYSAFAHCRFLFQLYTYVATIPGWCWGAVACGAVIYFVYWRRRGTYTWLTQKLQHWGIIPVNTTVENLMAIPHPEKNIQRTFVGVLSSETADKLKAMFRKNSCPEIVHLKGGHKLPPECRLVICCLPQNIRQMYLDDGTVFATLITEAGLSQAMVLIIIFGEKKTPEETLYDEDIYGNVLQQGQNLYKKGCIRSQGSLSREQTRDGWSKNISLVTVDRSPSTHQLEFMNKIVKNAFKDTRVQNESARHQN